MFSKSAQLKTKVKRTKKLTKSWYSKKMDIVFSELIRARDKKCLRCGKTDNLQCSHLASRKHLAGRWNEHNAITLCVGCHLYFWHKEPVLASEWLKNTFPSLWEECQDVKNQTLKWTLQDYETHYEQLKVRLKVLKD